MAQVMISYNWDHQDLAKNICQTLKSQGIPTWLDIENGIQSGDVNEAMANGVQNALAVVCLVSKKYELSRNCRKELTYADSNNKLIFPCMVDSNYKKASNWLGLIVSGLLYFDFTKEETSTEELATSLAKAISVKLGDKLSKTKVLSREENNKRQMDIFNRNFRGKVYQYVQKTAGVNYTLHFDSITCIYMDFSGLYMDESFRKKSMSKYKFEKPKRGQEIEYNCLSKDELGKVMLQNVKFLDEFTVNMLQDTGNYALTKPDLTLIPFIEFTLKFDKNMKTVNEQKKVEYDVDMNVHGYKTSLRSEDGEMLLQKTYGAENEVKNVKEVSWSLVSEKNEVDLELEILEEKAVCVDYLEQYFAEKVKNDGLVSERDELKAQIKVLRNRVKKVEKSNFGFMVENAKLKTALNRKK